ncbi:class I SAM-dependent methyltransferase [Corynebacterium cystitidis]|uniref:class I SAM-dependent methyltransferase n=1 Tax=Corynebacterium cystitidis TaxID=35757 RepID=UPI00211EA9B6|nr:methyltransferase domain-containing protein [Corynebacterium cystitidis]
MSEHNQHAHGVEDFTEFYAEGQKWSGNPNAALVQVASALNGGRALDIGCGEGADVAWLAENGWVAVGTDPVESALERARTAVDASPGTRSRAEFHALDLEGTAEKFATTPFDFVAAMYVPLSQEQGNVDKLVSLVAEGGTLLFVHHVFDPPRDILTPQQVADMLPAGWTVQRLDEVERNVTEGAGAHHKLDSVLVVTRG